MKKRPISVTVISWFLIITGLLGLAGSFFVVTSHDPRLMEAMARSPLPVPIQYGLLVGGTAITVASGVGMLTAQNWARMLYVIWSAVGLIIGIATSPSKMGMIPGGVVFLIIAFFLFQPKANQYFQP
jgi:hypothetical protein